MLALVFGVHTNPVNRDAIVVVSIIATIAIFLCVGIVVVLCLLLLLQAVV